MTDAELLQLAGEFNRTHPDSMEAMRVYAEALAVYERALAAMCPYKVTITVSDRTNPL